jgi:hypothetical protein
VGTKLRPLAAALVALTGCVTVSNRGAYPALEVQPGMASQFTAVWSGFDAADGAAAANLSQAFARDLAAAGIFQRLAPAGSSGDVILHGTAQVLHQPGDDPESHFSTGESILLVPMYAVWGVLLLVGVPSDCGDANAVLDLQAVDAHTGALVGHWQAKDEATSCSGLYYRGWPLGRALRRASANLLAQLRASAPMLREAAAPPPPMAPAVAR